METLQVEVFKTNIERSFHAEYLKEKIVLSYPLLQVNFDLEDCDKVLRIAGNDLPITGIIALAASLGYEISVLPD